MPSRAFFQGRRLQIQRKLLNNTRPWLFSYLLVSSWEDLELIKDELQLNKDSCSKPCEAFLSLGRGALRHRVKSSKNWKYIWVTENDHQSHTFSPIIFWIHTFYAIMTLHDKWIWSRSHWSLFLWDSVTLETQLWLACGRLESWRKR